MLDRGRFILTNRYTWLYILMLFPFIDYTLRNILPIPIVSSLWDEALLVLLIGICAWRAFEVDRPLPAMRVPLLAFTIMGLAYFVFNMHHFFVNIEGFRAVFQYMLAFFVGFYFLQNEWDARKALTLFIIVAGAVGLYGVYQYIIGVEVPQSWTDASENVRTRSFSIVQSPNVLGSYMVLSIPIAFGLALTSKGKIRLLFIAIAFVMLAALMFTGSRGAWIAFAGAVGLIFMFFDRRIFIVFIIVTLLAAFFVPQVSSRLSNLFSSTYMEKSSQDGRLYRWTNAYDIMRNQPLFGIGLGRYGGAVGERNFGTTYVDSYYFKTLAEVGLVGLSLYVWLMFSLLRGGYRIWMHVRGRPEFYLYGGILAGLIGVVLHNGFENIFEVPFMSTFFWLMTGFLLSFPYLNKDKREGGDITHA